MERDYEARDYEERASEEIKNITERGVLERFEAWAELYYKRYHRLAPGKSESVYTGRDSSSTENIRTYDAWAISGLCNIDCIHEVIRLKKVIENLEKAMEAGD